MSINARVGDGNQPPEAPDERIDQYFPEDEPVPVDTRSTQDTFVNRFGNLLLNF